MFEASEAEPTVKINFFYSYRWSESSATTDSSDDELMDLEEIMDSDTGMICEVFSGGSTQTNVEPTSELKIRI